VFVTVYLGQVVAQCVLGKSVYYPTLCVVEYLVSALFAFTDLILLYCNT